MRAPVDGMNRPESDGASKKLRAVQPRRGNVAGIQRRIGRAWVGGRHGPREGTRSLAAGRRAGSIPAEFHCGAPEAVAARLTEPVAGEQLDRGWRIAMGTGARPDRRGRRPQLRPTDGGDRLWLLSVVGWLATMPAYP